MNNTPSAAQCGLAPSLAWLETECGFSPELAGGGCVMLSRYLPGFHIWLTATGGGASMPEPDDWLLCVYPSRDESDSSLWDMSSEDVPADQLRPMVDSAIVLCGALEREALEGCYSRLRVNMTTPDDARRLLREDRGAAKPCPDLGAAMGAIIAADICDRWTRDIGIGFHPDTSADNYEPALSVFQAHDYERDMEELFSLPVCPYEAGLAAFERAGLIAPETPESVAAVATDTAPDCLPGADRADQWSVVLWEADMGFHWEAIDPEGVQRAAGADFHPTKAHALADAAIYLAAENL